jgi:hypothetical protein
MFVCSLFVSGLYFIEHIRKPSVTTALSPIAIIPSFLVSFKRYRLDSSSSVGKDRKAAYECLNLLLLDQKSD